MPRSRSGSFYCPLEPALPPLSIAQKAAISTCPVPSSTPSTPKLSSPLRRHVRSPSFDGADGPASVTLPAAKIDATTIGTTQPLSLRGKSQMTFNTPSKRFPWSPSKPSPLRRQTNAAPVQCPSALWTMHPELLPLYQSSSHSAPSSMQHKSRPRTQSSLRQSVTRHAFLSGPMGEKTHLYGLRVAWCVFGDVKEALAKDIFVRGSQAGYHHTTHKVVEQHIEEDAQHTTEHVEVVQQSDALSLPPPPRSRLRRENSFIWDVKGPLLTPAQLLAEEEEHFDIDVHAAVLDNLSDTDSESEYSDDDDEEEEDTTDTETESAESDDLDIDFDIELSLDEEEEVQRDILALLSTVGATVGDNKALDGNAHTWSMMSFEL